MIAIGSGGLFARIHAGHADPLDFIPRRPRPHLRRLSEDSDWRNLFLIARPVPDPARLYRAGASTLFRAFWPRRDHDLLTYALSTWAW